MIRYFDLTGQRIVAKLEIERGSKAAAAPPEAFEEFFKAPVREIDRNEYRRLQRKYEGGVDVG